MNSPIPDVPPIGELHTCSRIKCRQCGEMFTQRRWWQECCSDKCRSMWRQLHYITIPKEEYDRMVVLAKIGVAKLKADEAVAKPSAPGPSVKRVRKPVLPP